MNTILLTLIVWLTAGFCEPAFGHVNDQGDGRVKRIAELNREVEQPDSHSGEECYSALEPMAEYMQIIPASVLGCKTPNYARLKIMADGRYLLLYQNAKIASTIFYSVSDDMKTWSQGRKLFVPQDITTPAGADIRRYSSADATVLANGDVIAYVAFRATKGYRKFPASNGIMMRRSTDNGLSWSDEQVIYVGTNWEPYVLQLPSGKLQCYFTDTDPLQSSTGTSIVESTDNGHSWTPSGVSECLKVIRQHKGDKNGKPVYTDQMPSVRMLNDGHTLLGFMEARLEDADNKSYFRLSLVYGRDDWHHLADGETGPEERQTNVVAGAAGYVSQLRSGETLISCNINNIFSMKLGSADGRRFNGSSWQTDWFQPFDEKGYWGATEVVGTHEVAAVIHCDTGIQLGRFYLNHRIDAPRVRVKVDGRNAEWQHTQALFLGSESADAQTAIRAAHDGKKLYLLFDRTGSGVSNDSEIDVYLCFGNDCSKAVKITLAQSSVVATARFDGCEWRQSEKIKGIKCLTAAPASAEANECCGYATELAVPLSVFGAMADGEVLFNAVVRDGGECDTFTGSDVVAPDSWMKIKLKNE